MKKSWCTSEKIYIVVVRCREGEGFVREKLLREIVNDSGRKGKKGPYEQRRMTDSKSSASSAT